MAKDRSNTFWLSYSDLMTSLFFIMLVLFIVCIVKMRGVNAELEKEKNDANIKVEQYKRLLQLDQQFAELSKSSALTYYRG